VKYSPEIEQVIVQTIEANPDRELLLPDWAYWKGEDTPWIYVDQMPVRLVVHLYEQILGAIPRGSGLARKPGTHARNVNPYLWTVVPGPAARAECPKGHEYGPDDWVEGVGHRCQTCRAERRLARETGRPSPTEINRRKTHCPKGHVLVKRKNGRRRCLECPREQQARYLARKQGTA
jgi:hypothetical protein